MNRKPDCWIAVLVLICLVTTFAQAQEAKQGETVTKVVKIKYVDPEDLAKALAPFTQVGHALVVANKGLRTLTLSGNSDVVATMEQIVRQLDVEPPPKPPLELRYDNVEITAYLLVASDSNLTGQKMPVQLEPVLKQMRSTFSYNSYLVLDTIVIRSRVGQSLSADGIVSLPVEPKRNASYRFYCGSTSLTRDSNGSILHFGSLSLYLVVGGDLLGPDGKASPGTQTRGFNTTLDLRIGQMAVVGKTNVEVGNNTLIAVITARIVD